MPNVKFNLFYLYSDLTLILKTYVKEYPNLVKLELIGKSHEGADEVDEGPKDRAKIEWVVKTKKGTKVKLSAKHERAGLINIEVVLK